MRILIVAHFSGMTKGDNNRFNYLAKLLAENNEVELITSDFSHDSKRHRTPTNEKSSYKITLIHEPAYKKNVSLKRFLSHEKFGKNLKKYLDTIEKPDVLYCAVPSIDAAYASMRYAEKNGIRFIIDVQDLWPEAFSLVFNVPLLSNMIFYPMKRKINKVYACADEIVGVSESYCDRARSVNKKVDRTYPIYLGTDIADFDENVRANKSDFSNEGFSLGYCGTLGHSYDLPCVFEAMSILKNKGTDDITLHVCGDGPLRQKFEDEVKERQINVVFEGRLPYEKMCGVIASCDAAVNPIRKGAAQSIINKHADYAAAGIPVINTQESHEYKSLVEKYDMGFNCKVGDGEDVAAAIEELKNNAELCRRMGDGARKCALECFDRRNGYKAIEQLITNQTGTDNESFNS